MESLLILLLFPMVWPFIAKRIWDTTINYQEMLLQLLIVTVLTAGVWQLGKYGQTSDVEIWNGKITAKDRTHGSYVRSYDCNCYTSCSGSGSSRSCTTRCSTCYEDHYTVDWTADSTVGNFTFKSLDWTSKSVYKQPDPQLYKQCKVGEPASIEHIYTNYIQAVPESLFNSANNTTQFQNIPNYPSVYNHYKINRVLNVGSKVPANTIKQLNTMFNNELRTLGKQKEVNIIVILTGILDPSYRYAVETKWLGGKKNDVVVFIGTDGKKIIWADAMTWALNTGNELFQVKMRDGLQEIGTIDPKKIVSFVTQTIKTTYDRPHAEDYKYLEDAIEPPTWVIILSIIIAIGGSIGLTFWFHHVDVDFFDNNSYNYRRFRK